MERIERDVRTARCDGDVDAIVSAVYERAPIRELSKSESCGVVSKAGGSGTIQSARATVAIVHGAYLALNDRGYES